MLQPGRRFFSFSHQDRLVGFGNWGVGDELAARRYRDLPGSRGVRPLLIEPFQTRGNREARRHHALLGRAQVATPSCPPATVGDCGGNPAWMPAPVGAGMKIVEARGSGARSRGSVPGKVPGKVPGEGSGGGGTVRTAGRSDRRGLPFHTRGSRSVRGRPMRACRRGAGFRANHVINRSDDGPKHSPPGTPAPGFRRRVMGEGVPPGSEGVIE